MNTTPRVLRTDQLEVGMTVRLKNPHQVPQNYWFTITAIEQREGNELAPLGAGYMMGHGNPATAWAYRRGFKPHQTWLVHDTEDDDQTPTRIRLLGRLPIPDRPINTLHIAMEGTTSVLHIHPDGTMDIIRNGENQ